MCCARAEHPCSSDDTCLQPTYFNTILTFISTHSSLPLPATLTPSSDPKVPSTTATDPEKTVSAAGSTADTDEGSFEMVDQAEATGAGSVGPEDVAREKVRRVEEKL